ncbi:MAG: hypothetical protein DHS20C11_26680 [Lysobacteraceae bacterium]|nr:MAG: hypothetical protein DHS20C11_26680 [Xanthomonadaceae bacterium]
MAQRFRFIGGPSLDVLSCTPGMTEVGKGVKLPSMARRFRFIGEPSLTIHGESFSGIKCLGALALNPLHPPAA